MLMSALDYELPPERIATKPAEPRDHSRLMVVRRTGSGEWGVEHRRFYELPEVLRAGDVMVVNDTRVIPAKLELRKGTGAFVPGLFVEEVRAEGDAGLWRVMLRTRGRVKEGDELLGGTEGGVAGDYRIRLLRRVEGEKGMWEVQVTPPPGGPVSAVEVLERIGHVPLPPYIEKMRDPEAGEEEAFDRVRYQTVYARAGKSVAAPTAGLHFTPELLGRIEGMGVKRVSVDLEVGLGTFLPVESETLEGHRMHVEAYSVPPETVRALREQRGRGGRIVVIGTTAVRTLESAAERILGEGAAGEIRGETDLKIGPGYAFKLTDVLVTNFHLPRSTLMALVGAFLGEGENGNGVEKLKELYGMAVREGYRFYSYGDAMVILR